MSTLECQKKKHFDDKNFPKSVKIRKNIIILNSLVYNSFLCLLSLFFSSRLSHVNLKVCPQASSRILISTLLDSTSKFVEQNNLASFQSELSVYSSKIFLKVCFQMSSRTKFLGHSRLVCAKLDRFHGDSKSINHKSFACLLSPIYGSSLCLLFPLCPLTSISPIQKLRPKLWFEFPPNPKDLAKRSLLLPLNVCRMFGRVSANALEYSLDCCLWPDSFHFCQQLSSWISRIMFSGFRFLSRLYLEFVSRFELLISHQTVKIMRIYVPI